MTLKLVRLFETNKRKLEMKTVTLIRCILLGLTFVVFGLNGLWQTKAQRRQAMSYSIPTLLTRNLHDVFGENDPARRRAAIDEIFTEDCVFYEPNGGVYRGRDEIDRVAGSIRATHADSRYQPIAEPEELGNAGRVKWVEGRIGEVSVLAGTDFIIARDGRIAAVYLFFDKLP
jgi:SnoaL-like domain